MKVKATEDEVKAAVESVLGAEASVAGRLDFGNVNGVYKVGDAPGYARTRERLLHLLDSTPEPTRGRRPKGSRRP